MSPEHTLNDRVLCLAGMFQAAAMVKHCAYHGARIDQAVETSIHSLFQVEAENVEAIFAGVASLRLGLDTLANQLGYDTNPKDIEISRYTITLLYLEKKLSRQAHLLETLSRGIRDAQEQADFFSPVHDTVIASLADLYQRTISTLKPRIMVKGDPNHLQDPATARLIRTLLLAGIRAAMAWRQCGGTRWQLLLQRKTILHEVHRIRQNLSGIDTVV